ncbi:hypothetical protein ACIQI7_35115 [Kitasatospora sp. NPDC092039]|uniref:hypothetical protein n=1 Tax=Kitasatospora sp. NPDC092039 TaxID=3364086 RepID=UPI00382A5460
MILPIGRREDLVGADSTREVHGDMKTTKTLRHMAMGLAAGMLALAGAMSSTGTAQAATAHGSTLDEPGVLYPGDYLESDDTRLYMQGDGNFVLYKYATSNPTAVWSAPGAQGCGQKAIMQGDGNLVVYGAGNRVCWARGVYKTSSLQTASLVVSPKGGLAVLYVTPRQMSIFTDTLRSSDLY